MTVSQALPLPLHHHPNKIIPHIIYVIMKIQQYKQVFICMFGAVLLPIIIPYIHLGIVYQLWDKYTMKVNRETCSCSCWDTAFKGNYETGIANYKHVYFNITSNTFKIWVVTVLAVISLYETSKRTICLLITGQLRVLMVILLLSIIYPHYYTWWSYFNYWNDDYYNQWNHQLFFSFTELVSTGLVIYLLDLNNPVTPRKLLIIMDIAILHIVASGFDQFVANVLRREGDLHQVLRDIGFMIPDLLHVFLPLAELIKYAKSIGIPSTHLISNTDFVGSIIFIFSFWLICIKL